jgi:hypothetical protein
MDQEDSSSKPSRCKKMKGFSAICKRCKDIRGIWGWIFFPQKFLLVLRESNPALHNAHTMQLNYANIMRIQMRFMLCAFYYARWGNHTGGWTSAFSCGQNPSGQWSRNLRSSVPRLPSLALFYEVLTTTFSSRGQLSRAFLPSRHRVAYWPHSRAAMWSIGYRIRQDWKGVSIIDHFFFVTCGQLSRAFLPWSCRIDSWTHWPLVYYSKKEAFLILRQMGNGRLKSVCAVQNTFFYSCRILPNEAWHERTWVCDAHQRSTA